MKKIILVAVSVFVVIWLANNFYSMYLFHQACTEAGGIVIYGEDDYCINPSALIRIKDEYSQ